MSTKILAIHNPHTGTQRTERVEFTGAVGSRDRINEVNDHERYVEALKGQGCLIGMWTVEDWHRGYRPKWWVK